MRRTTLVICVAFVGFACSSTDPQSPDSPDASSRSSGSSDGSGDGGLLTDAARLDADGAAIVPACNAVTWCTDNTVARFHGAVPAAQGGIIAEGTYRLAYAIYPPDAGNDRATDTADLYTFSKGGFANPLSVGFGAVGTYSTASTTLSLQRVTACNGFFGVDAPSTDLRVSSYTASPSELTLIFTSTPIGDDAGAPYKVASVYRRITGDICDAVASDPATAGDSFRCHDASCTCAQTAGHALTRAQCPFAGPPDGG